MATSISKRDVEAAHLRIRQYVHKTSVITSDLLDEMTGCRLFFKCEHLQKVGAFKSRGALNAVLLLSDKEAEKGVATHSSGNHGAALARAAAIRGIPAYVVVPLNARQVKKDAMRSYGAEIIECESTLAARQETLASVVEDTGAAVIHPYDDDRVMAGQGTAALELLDQVVDLHGVIVPVGGGGLLAGCATVAYPNVHVYGAEPEMADDAYRSFNEGKLVTHHVPKTLCDGLQTTLGARNYEIIQDKVTDILLVSEQEIIDAMALIWTRLKQVVEPSSAVTLAAVIRNKEAFEGQRLGLMLTGGNVDLFDLPF
jgi:threonine dehydratase